MFRRHAHRRAGGQCPAAQQGYCPRQDGLNLASLESGSRVKVLACGGGHAAVGRLHSVGIQPGAVILKKGAVPAKGPVIVEKGPSQFALGYDLAQEVTVERLP